MPQNKGAVRPWLFVVFGVIAAITVGLLLIYKGVVKNPAPNLIKIPSPPRVELAPDYKNPLDKEAQYTNPFSEYKNPFDSLK